MRKKRISFDKADPKQSKKIRSIARVAADLFSRRGYLDTSMDDIAAARVTKGGVREHGVLHPVRDDELDLFLA